MIQVIENKLALVNRFGELSFLHDMFGRILKVGDKVEVQTGGLNRNVNHGFIREEQGQLQIKIENMFGEYLTSYIGDYVRINNKLSCYSDCKDYDDYYIKKL